MDLLWLNQRWFYFRFPVYLALRFNFAHIQLYLKQNEVLTSFIQLLASSNTTFSAPLIIILKAKKVVLYCCTQGKLHLNIEDSIINRLCIRTICIFIKIFESKINDHLVFPLKVQEKNYLITPQVFIKIMPTHTYFLDDLHCFYGHFCVKRLLKSYLFFTIYFLYV